MSWILFLQVRYFLVTRVDSKFTLILEQNHCRTGSIQVSRLVYDLCDIAATLVDDHVNR